MNKFYLMDGEEEEVTTESADLTETPKEEGAAE